MVVPTRPVVSWVNLVEVYYRVERDHGRPAADETLRELLPIPVLTGLPFGHVAKKLTLPYGAPARLSIHDAGYSLGLNFRA